MTQIPQQSMDFLRASAPFDLLQTEELNGLAQRLTVAYLCQENSLQIIQQKHGNVFLISSGQFSVKDSSGPERHVSEGDFFAVENSLKQLDFPIKVTVSSPGLVYCIPAQTFRLLVDTYPRIARFFATYGSDQLHEDAITDSKSMWLYRPISEVLSGNVVSTESDSSILSAVQIMSQNSVSSLLITEQQKLIGILTDRDIRNRIVAQQMDVNQPVSQAMTANPAQITHNRTLFDALCVMTERNIHHLPVVDRKSHVPLGMLTASDMIRHQRGNVLFLIDELAKATSLYELTRLSWQLPHYFAKHAKRLGDFDIAGKVLSQATDIMTRKLLTFFEQQHGTAPFDFCWLVYGSQAREDQTMGSDQDNGLLLAQTPTREESQYFANMTEYVCQGLGKCGIKLCDGNIMASNPKLRLSLEQAINETKRWVREPTNEAILHFNIFLDVRAVAGNTELFEQLQKVRAPLLKQPLFLAALARHNGQVNLPLSVFQQFVFAKGRSKPDCIDIKTSAVAVINNIVRIYALASGLTFPATLQRLDALNATTTVNSNEDTRPSASSHSLLSQKDAVNLKDIWLFLNRLRWRHQLEQNVTDNFVSISELSSIEKHQLKTAFKAIRRAQQAVVIKFAGGMS